MAFNFGANTTGTPTFGAGSITFGTPATQAQPSGSFQFGGAPAAQTPATNLFGAPNTAVTPSFGASNTSTSGFGTGLFGASASTAGAAFGTPTATPSGGITFGTPASGTVGFGAPTAASSAFGTPNTATGGLSFGTTVAAPSFGAATAAPSFGAPTAAPSFGAPAAAPSFGASTAVPSFGASAPNTGISFGTPASSAPSTGLTFGTPSSAPSSGLSFGAPATSAPGLNFGNPSSAPTTGLTFGAPASSAPTTGLTFGAPASSAPSGGLTFGAAATTTSTSITFGGTSASTPGTGLGFGAPAATTASTGLKFGAAASTGLMPSSTMSTQAPLFGAASSAPATGVTFSTSASSAVTPSTGLSFGAATSTVPSTGLNLSTPASSSGGLFAVPATTTSAPTLGLAGFSSSTTTSGGLSFGTTTTTSGGLSFGLGGSAATTATALGSTLVSSSTAPLGLGGVASAQGKTSVVTQKEVPPKEQPLPNEILQTVEQFKQFVKQQKQYSSDIARCSVRDYRKVEQEINALNKSITEVECELQKNRHIAEKLKYDTAGCLQNVEMAQRTHDTPAGLQYENTAPLKFFLDLADHFENEMQNIKMQIESADKYVKNFRSTDSITSQDLAVGMRRLHETFVALAGRLQSVHSQVESQKEMYINLKKHLFNDTSNPFIFEMQDVNTSTLKQVLFYSPPKVASGPTPFSNLTMGNLNPVVQQQLQQGFGAAPSTSAPAGFGTSISFGSSLGNPPTNTLFGNTSGLGQSTFGSSTFELQKPPTGNKRGKV